MVRAILGGRSRSTCSLVMFLVLAMLVAMTSVNLPTTQAAPPAKIDILIGFHGPPDPDLVKSVGGEIHRQFTIVDVIFARLPLQSVDALSNNAAIKYIDPDRPVYALSQEVPWGIDRVFGDEVYPFPTWAVSTGVGVGVAVLDTGIYGAHGDLTVVGGVNTLVDTDPNDWTDVHGHGTHVAGTIAALDNVKGVVGVSPGVSLYAVKVLDDEGRGTISSIVAGIEWAVTEEIPIINMSLGSGTHDQTLEDACAAAYTAGHLLVAAAGNSGNIGPDNVSYPARHASVIAVAASTSTDARASFSSRGPDVELIAPGESILSTVPSVGLVAEVMVGQAPYTASVLERSGEGTIIGPLVDCGLGYPVDFPDTEELPEEDWVALIARGEITFADKVRNAMNKGASAAIITNNDQQNPDDPGTFTLFAEPGDDEYPWVPAASVSYNSGQDICDGDLGVATVTVEPGDNYSSSSGTSMASPHVAGVAALVWAANPDLSNIEVRATLQDTAENLGLDANHQGHGLVRADLAVAHVTFVEGPPIKITVGPIDFGRVREGGSKTLEGISFITIEGPNISELKVSATAITGGTTPWAWGNGEAADTVKFAATITGGPTGLTYPLTTLEIVAPSTEYTFFTDANIVEGSYTADVTLTAGPRVNAELNEQMSAVLTYTVTVVE